MKNLFARTEGMRSLKEAFNLAQEANHHQISVNELIERKEALAWSRRNVLKTGMFATAGLMMPSILMSGCKKDKIICANIAIIGGGIAGLNCAYQLKKMNVDAIVYEAGNRFGGRMLTAQNLIGPGLTSELGGEYVDSNHEDIIALANEFGIKLLDTKSAEELKLTANAFRFGGQNYTVAQLATEFQSFSAAMQADMDSLPDDVSYRNATRIATLDNKSISEYLDGIGASGPMRKFIEVSYIGEFGLQPSELSSLTLLTLMSTDTSNGDIAIYGESDERYKIEGGSNAITDRLATECKDRTNMDHQLVKIDMKSNNAGYILHFMTGGKTIQIEYPIVVLAIPFSVLRNVELNFPIPAEKKFAIDKLSYGINAKLLLGFKERIWRTQGFSGYAYSDSDFQAGWDHTQLQQNNLGVGGYSLFTGGDASLRLAEGSAASQAQKYLPLIDQFFPGAATLHNGVAERMIWKDNKYSFGSYPGFTVGQYQTIAGREMEPVGNVFFAGDHCNLDFQGYMNAGALTGKEVALTVSKIKV
jgi:monoamine oxidase